MADRRPSGPPRRRIKRMVQGPPTRVVQGPGLPRKPGYVTAIPIRRPQGPPRRRLRL